MLLRFHHDVLMLEDLLPALQSHPVSLKLLLQAHAVQMYPIIPQACRKGKHTSTQLKMIHMFMYMQYVSYVFMGQQLACSNRTKSKRRTRNSMTLSCVRNLCSSLFSHFRYIPPSAPPFFHVTAQKLFHPLAHAQVKLQLHPKLKASSSSCHSVELAHHLNHTLAHVVFHPPVQPRDLPPAHSVHPPAYPAVHPPSQFLNDLQVIIQSIIQFNLQSIIPAY